MKEDRNQRWPKFRTRAPHRPAAQERGCPRGRWKSMSGARHSERDRIVQQGGGLVEGAMLSCTVSQQLWHCAMDDGVTCQRGSKRALLHRNSASQRFRPFAIGVNACHSTSRRVRRQRRQQECVLKLQLLLFQRLFQQQRHFKQLTLPCLHT